MDGIRKNRRGVFVLYGLAVAAVFSFWMGLGIGTATLNLFDFWEHPNILWHIRLPRVLLGAMAGAGLALAGSAFQALLRNPLADPYIVGVCGGASLGGVLALVLGIGSYWLLPVCAFSGAVTSALGLFALARASGRTDPLSLLLAGVVFNAFAGALVTFLKTIVSAQKAQEILFWLLGNVYAVSCEVLLSVNLYTLVGSFFLLILSGNINLLCSSDDEAASLGISVERTRLFTFLAASLVVGAIVSVCGMIGFVGLVVPHVLRRWVGPDHRILFGTSMLGGACFLMLADALARLSFYFFGTEIPVGAITALTGGPFFLAVLLTAKEGRSPNT